MTTLLKRRRLFLSSEDGLEDSHGDFTLPLSTELMDCQTVGLKCKAWLQEVQMRHSFQTIDSSNDRFYVEILANVRKIDPNQAVISMYRHLVILPHGTMSLNTILELVNTSALPYIDERTPVAEVDVTLRPPYRLTNPANPGDVVYPTIRIGTSLQANNFPASWTFGGISSTTFNRSRSAPLTRGTYIMMYASAYVGTVPNPGSIFMPDQLALNFVFLPGSTANRIFGFPDTPSSIGHVLMGPKTDAINKNTTPIAGRYNEPVLKNAYSQDTLTAYFPNYIQYCCAPLPPIAQDLSEVYIEISLPLDNSNYADGGLDQSQIMCRIPLSAPGQLTEYHDMEGHTSSSLRCVSNIDRLKIKVVDRNGRVRDPGMPWYFVLCIELLRDDGELSLRLNDQALKVAKLGVLSRTFGDPENTTMDVSK